MRYTNNKRRVLGTEKHVIAIYLIPQQLELE